LKNTARRDQNAFGKVLSLCRQNLAPGGDIWVLFPQQSFSEFDEMMQNSHFNLSGRIDVINKHGSIFRVIASYSENKSAGLRKEFQIKDKAGQYTADYLCLMEPFYYTNRR
jgi:tRNA1(Val) A37 N6-methylase TrmN6